MDTGPEMQGVMLRAVAAAAAITSHVQRSLGDAATMAKPDQSPVTIADLASQAVIATMLAEHASARGDRLVLVGEEDADALRTQALTEQRRLTLEAAQRVLPGLTEEAMLDAIDLGCGAPAPTGFWTLDPIDGTKGFVRREQYAIALAWIENGRPTRAAMACPNLSAQEGDLMAEPRGDGCIMIASAHEPTQMHAIADAAHMPPGTLTVFEGERLPIVCGSREGSEDGASRGGWLSRTLDGLSSSAGGLGPRLRLDSQAKYAVVARGQADVYLRLPRRPGFAEAIWDHAPGALIAQQAGAIVTDIDGKPLDFSTGERMTANRGVVCASPRWHAAVIEAVQQAAPARAR